MSIAHAKQWQRERAGHLHREFCIVDRAIEEEGAALLPALALAHGRLSGTILSNGKFLRIGSLTKGRSATLVRAWYDWIAGGKAATALIQKKKGFETKIPAELVREFQRRCTKEGCLHYSAAMDSLEKDYRQGVDIDGVKSKFIRLREMGLPLDTVVDFPFSRKTLYRWKPKKAERAGGIKGRAALRMASAHVDMDYSKLRKCELFTLDDVRLDIKVINENTGRAVVVTVYILMEVASRSIVAFHAVCDRIKQEDVDELLAFGLRVPGYGIGVGYTTHILFEQGTTACSEPAKLALEGVSEGRIKIHRTGQDGGIRWIGAAQDKVSGKATSKGVIEKFNHKLHIALMNLPGQSGRDYETQPSNLGYVGPDQITPKSLIAQAMKLDDFNYIAGCAGQRLQLELPMLYFKDIHVALRAAMEDYNNETGAAYSGHGFFQEAEVAPGVWKEVPA